MIGPDPLYVIFGFIVGMLVSTIFVPPTSLKKFYPDVHNPDIVLKNPGTENGCFRLKAYQVSCTENITQLNK
jgi:hypothetical protein